MVFVPRHQAGLAPPAGSEGEKDAGSTMSRRSFRKHRPPVGSAPGAFSVPPHALVPRIHVIDYDAERVDERDIAHVEQLARYRQSKTVTWIDIQGIGDERLLREIASLFEIHPLAMADIVNVPQRPKVEAYDHQALLITQWPELQPPGRIDFEQLSLVLGTGYVLTFQQRYGSHLEPVARRIRQGALIRRMGADYLAYALIDAAIDAYYPVLEGLGDRLERIEDWLVQKPRPALLREVHDVRRELLQLRRAVWPQREAVNALLRESPFITDAVRIYLRDCYDHVVQIMDVVETHREMASSLMEVHLSSISNRTNEVMKMLTVVATIFIPLTFIVGVYGMNFEHMPELSLPWAYPLLWFVMILLAAGMLWYFRRAGWLGSEEDGTG